MICPYCAEDVPADSQLHQSCKRASNKPFPPLYLDYHNSVSRAEPVVVSVIGFPGHGKTVFLCALFDYIDDQLTYAWRKSFHNLVLDQESLTQLNYNRGLLRHGELPPPTELDFPRPGIFRLKHMPSTSNEFGLPPLVDTTILIYDPPGEAFQTESKIVEYASFVKRSNCVLFLIDLTALDTSIAHGMAQLLDTYVLGMRRMGIRQQSQHLIVVYTKADEMKVSVPEFANLWEREPWLKEYLEDQRPETLAEPHRHFKQLEKVSSTLADFTYSDLRAGRFTAVADDWFASVSYTAVSSLGSAPEFQDKADDYGSVDVASGSGNGKGSGLKRLMSEMSPRGMADPLLYVLSKSLPKRTAVRPSPPPPPPRSWWDELPPWAGAAFAVVVGATCIVVILLTLFALISWAWSEPETRSPSAKPSVNSRPPVRRSATQHH